MLKRLAVAAAVLSSALLPAQSRIMRPISATTPTTALTNTVVPRARLATDLGLAPAGLTLPAVTLRFNMTAAQTTALDQLLADQQNPRSARFHQWLTPEQFASQFGLSSSDIASVSGWLTAQGLTVTSMARSRTFVTVSGTAGQLQRAFGVSLHNVTLDGEVHVTNLTEPTLPTPIAAVVGTITGLNDFRLKPHAHARVTPDYTSSISGNHFIAPGDFYTIYDLKPLLTSSITGAGVTIAVMGQTDISLADVAAFRAASGLAPNPPTVKLFFADPNTQPADIDEAQLDVEWSGAVAPSASILYVNSTDVIGTSLTQTIDNNLAPIITVSYGNCEAGFGSTNLAAFNQLFRQGNAQGQTILGPAGDSGAADCDYQVTTATNGLTVDFPASSPNVTGVGGTMFNEGAGTYFSNTNNSNAGSALSYIPEAIWNESSAYGSLAAGGGGRSAFFTKPAFQTAVGVPNDFSRDVPDLSFNAAAIHEGYLFCSQGFCTNGFRNAASNLDVIGGTSVSTPAFAGILALLEQKISSRVGNANPTLYGLANSTFSTAVFHDITTGNNAVPCTAGTPDCPNGGTIGYNATPGYDLASGLGSVDVFNMINDWTLVTPTGITGTTGQNASSVTLTATPTNVTAGTSIVVTSNVASATSGLTTTPTGTVQLLIDNVVNIGASATLVNGAATLSLSTVGLTSGLHTVTAAYSGDSVYLGTKGVLTIDITSATLSDFSISPSSATTTVVSGHDAPSITFSISPVNGFIGKVTMTASSLGSSLAASYAFTINPVIISTSSPGTTVFTLSAYQAAGKGATGLNRLSPAGAAHNSAPTPIGSAAETVGGSIMFAALLLFAFPRRRRQGLALLSAAVFSIALLASSGCSSNAASTAGGGTGGQINTAPGTYSVAVTATGTNGSGNIVTHNSTVTLVVQ